MENKNILVDIAKAASENVNRKEFRDSHGYDIKEIVSLIDEAIANDAIINKIKNTLYPNGFEISDNFFEKLNEFYVLCGFNENTRILCAKISIIVFEEIGKQNTNRLLTLLVEPNKNYFWYYVGVLGILLGNYELDPEFASEWFWKIAEKIKFDLAGGEFYKGIEEYASNFPNLGKIVIDFILNHELDESYILIASIILGAIRANQNNIPISNFKKFEFDIKNSKLNRVRIIFYKSYFATYKRMGVNIQELGNLLNIIKEDEISVRDSIYYLIERSICYQPTDKDLIKFAINWIKINVFDLTDIEKHLIICTLKWIGWKLNEISDENIPVELNKIIKLVLPIKDINQATWRELEDYLQHIFDFDKKCFNNTFYTIIEYSNEDFRKVYNDDGFNLLSFKLETNNYNEFLFPLLLSKKRELRRTGFELTLKWGLTIPKEYLQSGLTSQQLRILLYGTALSYVASEKIGDFLLSIEPLYNVTEEDVKNEFTQEMIFQALNFPGACLGKWEEIIEKSDILKYVVNIAKEYFEKMEKTNELSANSFSHPAILNGEKQWQRDFSNKIREGAMEKSIFMKFAKVSEILYGTKWSIYDYNKNIHNPSGFGETSHSMEWPRMELIDPEGMVIRRMNMNSKLTSLEST